LVRLSVTIEGSNESPLVSHPSDVVLIHGTGSSAQMWRPHLNLLLARGYRCILPDLRGHGASPEPEEQTDIGVHLRDLEETFEHLDIHFPAIFIGHSLGAIIAMSLAERKPEMVRQIFAVGMPGKVLPAISLAFKLYMASPYEMLRGTDFHKVLPWRQRMLIDTHRHSLTEIVDNFADLDFVSQKMEVKCPVHFAVGRWDPVAPHYFAAKMHEIMPGSTLQVFEWAGHNFMDQYPEQFGDWLHKYLDELERHS
jgi:pimeloyl-ACP methyl ester carboxylesterase